MRTDERMEVGRELFLATEGGEETRVRELCAANPWLVGDHIWTGVPWLTAAARAGSAEMLAALLDLGFNVDAM